MIDELLIDTVKIKQKYEENLYKIRCEFLKSICNFEGFIEGYVDKSGNRIFICTEDCRFSNNKKYYQALREFLKDTELLIEILLLEKDEVKEYKDCNIIDDNMFKCTSTTR